MNIFKFSDICVDLNSTSLSESLKLALISGIDDTISPFSWDITGRNYVAMACVGFGFYMLTILIEYNFFIKSK